MHFIERGLEGLVIHERLEVLLAFDELDVLAVHRVQFAIEVVEVATGLVFVVAQIGHDSEEGNVI